MLRRSLLYLICFSKIIRRLIYWTLLYGDIYFYQTGYQMEFFSGSNLTWVSSRVSKDISTMSQIVLRFVRILKSEKMRLTHCLICFSLIFFQNYYYFFFFFIGLKKYDTTKRYLLCLICFSKTVMWYRDQTSVFLYLNPKKCLVISHALPVEFEKKSETNLNISWDTWVRLRTLLSYKRETSEK